MDQNTESALIALAGAGAAYLFVKTILEKPGRVDKVEAIKKDERGRTHLFGSNKKGYLQHYIFNAETGEFFPGEVFRESRRYWNPIPYAWLLPTIKKRIAKTDDFWGRVYELGPETSSIDHQRF